MEGQRLLAAEAVDDVARLLVDIARRRRRQALEQAEDQIAFLRGHGKASCWPDWFLVEQEIVILCPSVKRMAVAKLAVLQAGP